MARPHTQPVIHSRQHAKSVVLVLGLLAWAMIGSGCVASLSNQGRTNVPVVFQRPQLSADLDRAVTPEDVAAAARVVLRRSGYTITTDRATGTKVSLSAKAPDAWMLERMDVRASDTGEVTRIIIRVYPFGDEPASRSVLDGMLAELGR